MKYTTTNCKTLRKELGKHTGTHRLQN